MSTRSYSLDEAKRIARGACFLGSGGGGPLATGLRLLDTLDSDTSFPVCDVDDVVSGLTAVVALVGSPAACDKLNNADAAVQAFKCINEQYDKGIKYVVPVELGGLNTVIPFMVAEQCGLTLIIAEGAGRAVPTLCMTSYAAAGLKADPTWLAGNAGRAVTLHVDPVAQAEGMLRPILADFDEEAGLAMWVMTPVQLAATVKIRGTLDLALRLGGEFGQPGAGDALMEILNLKEVNRPCRRLVERGKVTLVQEQTAGGFDLGRVVIDAGAAGSVTIYNQNENLLLYASSEHAPRAIAPNLICYLDADTAAPHSNTSIKPGMSLSVYEVAACAAFFNQSALVEATRDVLVGIGYAGAPPARTRAEDGRSA